MSKSILGFIVALFITLQIRAEQPIFNIGSIADVTPGQIIDIDFHVDDFAQIISAQYSVNWNPNVLRYRTIKNFNPMVPGLSLSVFGTTQALLDAGRFTLSWIEPSATAISIPDGSLFYTVEFEVIGSACQSSPVAITEDPLEIEVSEDGVNDVELVTHNGLVSVEGTGCAQDLNIIGNSVIGACGSTTCIRFTVENFTTVGAMEFSLVYNPAVLQFNHFQNYAPLLSFGDGNTNLLSPGTLRVVWFNGNAVNESLPDGTALFDICFDVIGTGGQSSEITFGNDPPVMISDIDGNLHNVTIQPAQISAQCALEGFALIADTVCTTPDGVTCIDINVNDFDDIVALQFSINWDSTKFIFDHLEGFGLPGLDATGFGTPTPGNPGVVQGQLTVSWIDLSLNGVTIPDFSTIFRLCLKAVGPVGSSTAITFSDTPLEIEIATLDSVLEYGLLHGLAEIKQTCTTGCIISYIIVPTSPACPRESTGSIDLTVTLENCSGTPTYLWSIGEFTTQDLSGLPAGFYTVTITLGTEGVVIANTTVSDPPALSVSSTFSDPNPPGSSTGSIDIEVSGGTPPYSFLWSFDSRTTEDLIGILPAGTYSVTITDSKGCTFIPDAWILGSDASATINDVTCAGGSNGSINLTVTYGTPPYTFLWNTVPPAVTEDINNLKAGTYCVTITDNTGSTRDACFMVRQPLTLNVSAGITDDVNTNCHGAIDLNVTGGTQPYSYVWSNGEVTQDVINLCVGQHCVTITHAGGACITDTCFMVNGNFALNLVATQFGDFQTSCNDVCDGEITSVVTGGTGPFTYHWSNNETTPDLNNLCPGVYELTVTDASGQTATATRTITSPGALTLTLITTLPTDFSSSDGAASVVVNGGVPNYTYQWTGPVSGITAALNNLPAGNYQITVKDANQCQTSLPVPLFPGGGDLPCYSGIRIITPNSDGKNDYFIITCIFDVDNHLSIYNRSGGLVYETDNYTNNWDGVDGDNQPIADGGYLWVLEIIHPAGTNQILKGTVNVLRTAD